MSYKDNNFKDVREKIYEGTIEYSKIIVLVIIVLVVIFSKIVLDIFRETGVEPSTLIVAVFAMATGEFGFMMAIKRKKIDKGED